MACTPPYQSFLTQLYVSLYKYYPNTSVLKYDWDASTYDSISDVIESWGLDLIERINWKGNEIVLDAGCASGRLTKIISTKIPKGKVFAVDLDSSIDKNCK